MRELRLWAAAAAGPVVAAGFYTLAALRRRRSLHPTGVGYQGRLRVPDERPPRPGVPLFQAGATHPVLVRFSRGAGLPEPLPDALGVAIKLPDAHGPGVDQDLLLTSSTDRPLLRRLLFPARSFVRGAFSTALPYDLGSERVVLLLVPAPINGGRSAGGGGRRPVGGLAEPATRRRLPGKPTRPQPSNALRPATSQPRISPARRCQERGARQTASAVIGY